MAHLTGSGTKGPVTREIPDFGGKLQIALAALNMSRARLTVLMRVNKALPSRWSSGASIPSAHSMEKLTAIVGEKVPGFNQLSWTLPIDAFERLFAAASEPPSTAGAIVGVEHVWNASAADLLSRVEAYAGLYAVFHAFAQPQTLGVNLCVVWKRGEQLFIRIHFPTRPLVGEFLSVRQHLYTTLVSEGPDIALFTGFVSPILGRRALLLDSLWLTLVRDGFNTPTCSRGIIARIGDLPNPETPPPDSALDAIWARMEAATAARSLDDICGPAECGVQHRHRVLFGRRTIRLRRRDIRLPAHWLRAGLHD